MLLEIKNAKRGRKPSNDGIVEETGMDEEEETESLEELAEEEDEEESE